MIKGKFSGVTVSLAVAALLGLSACSSSSGGGDDDTTTSATSASYSGTGIDGLIVGATVCIDVNQNNACDAGEPSALTDERGKFTIASTTATGPLLLVGGTDLSTGAAFTGSLKAPAGSTVVTPLTSAIQSLVEKGKTPSEAERDVKTALGVPSDVNVTQFDPYEEIDGANASQAQAVLAKQTQLQVLVHSATVTLAGADANTEVNSTMSSVFDAIADNFDGATTAVELDTTVVTAATKKAADVVFASNPAAKVASKAIAQTAAQTAVTSANTAAQEIEAASTSNVLAKLDAAITQVNGATEDELKQAAIDAITEAKKLTEAKIAEIEALQEAQQTKEAEILAAKQAQADAEAALAAAKAAAEADAADRAKYEAYLEAQAAAAQAAAEKAAAEQAAADAEALAAAEEKAISAEAAQREAQAQAAAAQAEAEKLAAELEAQAAEKAVADAKAAADLAAAQAAAEAAEQEAAAAIAQAQVKANKEIGAFLYHRMDLDVNTTIGIQTAIRDLNLTGINIDANVTTAQNALLVAQIALINLQGLVDTNSTDVNSSVTERTAIEVQVGVVSSQLLYAQILKETALLAKAEAEATAVKAARIAAYISEINATKNTAEELFDINASALKSEIEADMLYITTIASNPTYAQTVAQKFADANTSANAALEAYNDANASIEAISVQYAEALAAQANLDEFSVLDAKEAATQEKAKLEGYLQSALEKAAEIKTIRAEITTMKEDIDNSITSSTLGFSDGMQVYSYYIDEEDGVSQIVIENHLISSNSVSTEGYVFDMNATTFVSAETADFEYGFVNGAWVERSGSAVINADGTLDIDGFESLKLLSEVDLANPDATVQSYLDDIARDFNSTPLSFSSGAKVYVLGFKNLVEYRADYVPHVMVAPNWEDSNETFNDIVTYMQHIGGFGRYGIGCKRDLNATPVIDIDLNNSDTYYHEYPIIDSNGNQVTTLTEGLTGDIVFAEAADPTQWSNQVKVGTWSVVKLSNNDLVVVATQTDDTYGDFFTLIANVNGTVMLGDYRQPSLEYEMGEYPFVFNDVAINDIKAYILQNYSAFVAPGDTNVTTGDNNTTSGDTNTTNPERTTPMIGSWINKTYGVHIAILDDASYFMMQDTNGSGGILGGIELGWFTLSADKKQATDLQAKINSNLDDSAVGGTLVYNDLNDTMSFSDGDGNVTFVRDDGDLTTPWVGAWLSVDQNNSNNVTLLILESNGKYITADMDLNSSTSYNDGGDIWNAFEMGDYTATAQDTNVTLTVIKDPSTDYNGEMGPPAGDMVFDVSNFPTIVNPMITFEKVVLDTP